MAPDDDYVQVRKKTNMYLIQAKPLLKLKKEQCWRYDPTIKYEAVRRYAETEAMAEEAT